MYSNLASSSQDSEATPELGHHRYRSLSLFENVYVPGWELSGKRLGNLKALRCLQIGGLCNRFKDLDLL